MVPGGRNLTANFRYAIVGRSPAEKPMCLAEARPTAPAHLEIEMNVRLLVIVVLVIFAHARGAYVASDARYKIQDLGVGSAAPVGINDLGEIVAQIVMSDGSRESVVGRPRQFAPIPV